MPEQKRHRSKQDYGTPADFLRAARKRLGIVDFYIDLAAAAHNAVVPNYYDEAIDGLAQSWTRGGRWGWLNPPFANIGPWTAKAVAEKALGANTAMLIPASLGANWWRLHVHGKALVLGLNGRITFLGTPPNPKTGKIDAYPKDCALLLYGPYVSPGYDVWTWPADALELHPETIASGEQVSA